MIVIMPENRSDYFRTSTVRGEPVWHMKKVYIHTHIYMHIYTHTQIHTHVHILICVWVCIWTRTCGHTQVHTLLLKVNEWTDKQIKQVAWGSLASKGPVGTPTAFGPSPVPIVLVLKYFPILSSRYYLPTWWGAGRGSKYQASNSSTL